MGNLEGVQMVAIPADDIDAIEPILTDPVDQIDRKRDVDALLLTIRSTIALKEFESCNMTIRSLHCKKPAFPRLVWRRRSVEPGKSEFVGATELLDQWTERGIAEPCMSKGSD